MTDSYAPRPEHHFTFGLWTAGAEARPPLDPVDAVHRLAGLGAYGVNFHDEDLVPAGASPTERETILKRFRRALDATGLKVPMATTNLFSRPVFKDGAFTANDPDVRRLAVRRTCQAVDLGAELGAGMYVLRGGREGVEAHAGRDVRLALDRYKEAVDLCCEHVLERRYPMRLAIEPKPSERRGDLLLPTVGHALAFIEGLEWPDMVGVNPEFAHETTSGLSFADAVAQALWHGKLFHIDLNGQRAGRNERDYRFGAEGIREAFFTVQLLEDARWAGMRNFDAQAYRTADAEGLWDFARGCMRIYLILAEKARRFHEDPEIQDALAVAGVTRLGERTQLPGGLDAVRRVEVDESALAAGGGGHERLDQLVTELLLGAR
ncbi:MAG TPA: xylose isomerase [Acidimicrobiales bacterium]|nr:xylose isomerase [Acidimicrobiales bacterium]